MNRSLFLLLGALALGAAVLAGSYFVAQRATVLCCTQPTDDLSWLRTEFHLNDAELARIRELHEGYLPQCEETCALVAAKKRDLAATLGGQTNVPAEAQIKLAEIAALRVQCQSNMLQHFVTVSQAMPPEAGQRYLAEMKRLTLGNPEQMEQSMSGEMSHEHHH